MHIEKIALVGDHGMVVAASLLSLSLSFFLAPAASAQNGSAPDGIFVMPALGGTIFGYDIDRSGTEGLLSESVTLADGNYDTAVETFDQTTGNILKVILQQENTQDGFVTFGIFGTSVGLVRESFGELGPAPVYGILNPLSGNKFTGMWTPPLTGQDFIISMPESQGSRTAPVLYFNSGGTPPSSLVVGTDVGANTFGSPITLTDPVFDIGDSPVMAYDSQTSQAIIASSFGSPTDISELAEVDLATGAVTEFQGVGLGFVNGIAVDPTSGIACTSTYADFSIELYNLATHAGFKVPLQGAISPDQSGFDVELDPIHKVFLVAQAESSITPTGSSILVYNEQGKFIEAVNGLSLPTGPVLIALQPSQRFGYVLVGQTLSELQQFTY